MKSLFNTYLDNNGIIYVYLNVYISHRLIAHVTFEFEIILIINKYKKINAIRHANCINLALTN